MKLRLIAVGKLKEGYLRAGVADYAARLQPYVHLDMVEVPGLPDPPRPTAAAVTRVKEGEADLILQRLAPGEPLIALDPRGRVLDSEGFAAFLRPYDAQGSRLAFALGGSWGLGRAVLDRAVLAFSLSSLTFPHGLARLILLEQLYRACKILRGETYHK
ncbi:MAG: 23S rRNA (pseudouridine(1915)-N(3))-methyltransferase RlmH [Bacteroidota bacterium]